MEATLCHGRVAHLRQRPARHGFTYGVFFLRLPLSGLDRIANCWLSVDRWNVFSVMRADFGARDGSEPLAWARGQLARAGITAADGEVVLQAFPRMLGYAFNPIAIYECQDRQGRLRSVICAVSNTFGEHHSYVLAHADQRPIDDGDWLTARKAFHVSPFCEVAGHYRFRFGTDAAHPAARIDYHDRDGALLVTAISGTAHALTAPALAHAFFRYPLMTLAVIARIHLQALRLWAKRVPWFRKPQPPLQETTFEQPGLGSPPSGG